MKLALVACWGICPCRSNIQCWTTNKPLAFLVIPSFLLPSESYITTFYTTTQVAYVWSVVTHRSGLRAHEGNSWAPLVVTMYGLKTGHFVAN